MPRAFYRQVGGRHHHIDTFRKPQHGRRKRIADRHGVIGIEETPLPPLWLPRAAVDPAQPKPEPTVDPRDRGHDQAVNNKSRRPPKRRTVDKHIVGRHGKRRRFPADGILAFLAVPDHPRCRIPHVRSLLFIKSQSAPPALRPTVRLDGAGKTVAKPPARQTEPIRATAYHAAGHPATYSAFSPVYG